MPNVIRNTGDPRHARTLDGKPVERQEEIYLPSYKAKLRVLPQSIHFVYYDGSHPRGSTLFCTCGAAGIVVGYEAYKKYNSYIGNEVIACHSFIMNGKHNDNSHE